MHIISLREKVVISPENVVPANTPYLCEDTNGAQLLTIANGGTMMPLTARKPFDETQDWNGKKILFVRVGGLGDLTLLTPVLREIKRRWTSVQIDVACHKEFAQAIENLPYCKPIAFPLSMTEVESYDAWCFLENAIENNEDAKTMHSVDVYAKLIGLTGDFNKVQDYVVTEREKIWQDVAFPRTKDLRRIAIQVSASAKCRTYPQAHLQRVVQHFIQKGWEVFMMGAPGEVKEVENEPKNFIVMTDGYTFRQRAAVLATCDVVFAPDSSLTHIAGALDVPCVAAYGPFPWQVRTKYNPHTFGINGVGKCAPCFHHQWMQNRFPKDCPSRNRGVCEVLERIKPERVIALLTKHARNASTEEQAMKEPEDAPTAEAKKPDAPGEVVPFPAPAETPQPEGDPKP